MLESKLLSALSEASTSVRRISTRCWTFVAMARSAQGLERPSDACRQVTQTPACVSWRGADSVTSSRPRPKFCQCCGPSKFSALLAVPRGLADVAESRRQQAVAWLGPGCRAMRCRQGVCRGLAVPGKHELLAYDVRLVSSLEEGMSVQKTRKRSSGNVSTHVWWSSIQSKELPCLREKTSP